MEINPKSLWGFIHDKKTVYLLQFKEVQSSELGMLKGIPFVYRKYPKGYLLCKAETPGEKFVEYLPSGFDLFEIQ